MKPQHRTRRRRAAATAILLLALGACQSAAASPDGLVPKMPVRGICAHRGTSATHPENTLAALREAVELGAHMVEFDLRSTSDGEIVLMHDDTLGRTTSGSGLVAETTLEDLKRLDAGAWKGRAFREERVPTLEEALETLPTNIWINLHVKGDARLAATAARIVEIHGRVHQTILTCGPTAAAGARDVAPRILICNAPGARDDEAYRRESIEIGTDFVQLDGDPDELYSAVRSMRRLGIRVIYRCTDDPGRVWRLLRSGVDFVLVDDVAPMLQLAERLGIGRLPPSPLDT